MPHRISEGYIMITNKKWNESQESLMLKNAWQSLPKESRSGVLEVYVGLVQNHLDKLKVHF